jgi:hypothetical protein
MKYKPWNTAGQDFIGKASINATAVIKIRI